ncbi:unnamed protein product [Moneuplotes crassus]|uniref:Uncharacterized protein n=1 Tax=Euplotes crassus TaxID=5936 RepID=A0AAD1Y750_EUPCR|nr:unnamed protein product [Moneuplotes crassus]
MTIKGKDYKKFRDEFPTKIQDCCSNKKLRLRKVLEDSFNPINHEQNSFDSISESLALQQNSKNLVDQQETLLNNIDSGALNQRSSINESSEFKKSNKEESKCWDRPGPNVDFIRSEDQWNSEQQENYFSSTIQRDKNLNILRHNEAAWKSRTENNHSSLSNHPNYGGFSLQSHSNNIPKSTLVHKSILEENKSQDDHEDILNNRLIDELMQDPIEVFEFSVSEPQNAVVSPKFLHPPSKSLN